MKNNKKQQIPVKMYRSDERLTVAAPMPGLEPQDINVEVTEGALRLHAELRGEFKGQNEVIADEWDPGGCEREIELPNAVDAQAANLTYNNGVLVAVLPIVERTRPGTLQLEKISATQGERIGNTGHPVQEAGTDKRGYG